MSIKYECKVIDNRLIYQYGSKDLIAFKQLASKIRHSANIELPSRNSIISNIANCMSNGFMLNGLPIMSSPEVKIIRGDIQHFFPSVNDHKLLKMVKNSIFLSHSESELLKSILSDPNVKGLPQGNPLSSVLSEIYLSTFDKKIKIQLSPLYYARFVDDFIIIIPSDGSNNNDYKSFLEEELERLGLSLSKSKYMISEFSQESSFSIDFLGYHFESKKQESESKKQESQILSIKISSSKIKKIISKINHIFKIFSNSPQKNRDFLCLYYRIEFILKGVKTVDYRGAYKLRGIPYTYNHVNDFQNLKSIQSRIMTLSRINKLSRKQHRALYRLSFSYGDKNKSAFYPRDYTNYASMSNQKFNSIYTSLNLKNMKTKKRRVAEFSVLINNLR